MFILATKALTLVRVKLGFKYLLNFCYKTFVKHHQFYIPGDVLFNGPFSILTAAVGHMYNASIRSSEVQLLL